MLRAGSGACSGAAPLADHAAPAAPVQRIVLRADLPSDPMPDEPLQPKEPIAAGALPHHTAPVPEMGPLPEEPIAAPAIPAEDNTLVLLKEPIFPELPLILLYLMLLLTPPQLTAQPKNPIVAQTLAFASEHSCSALLD